MPLDPQAQDFLTRLAAANLPSFQEHTVAQLRAQMDMSTHFLGELPRVAHVEDRGIPGPGGTLRVRIITPQAAGNGLLPVLVYFHGGGWVLGDIESHEGICRALANAGGVIVVNALPPLKVVQLLGNACLSPTTLAPKGPFRPRGPGWILWFSLDSVEPHRVNSNDLVGALGAIPTAWWRTSHDVLARLMFSSRADSFSPANRLHPHYQRANSIVPGAGSRSRIVYNNHHSFTYAASVA